MSRLNLARIADRVSIVLGLMMIAGIVAHIAWMFGVGLIGGNVLIWIRHDSFGFRRPAEPKAATTTDSQFA